MNFNLYLQEWIKVDNKLKTLNEQMKELRDKRNELEQPIIKYALSNNLSTTVIEEHKLKFVNNRVSEPLTFKYLEKTLGEIIKSDQQVKAIIEHLKQKRIIKTVPEIKRFSNN
jgi:Glu-tRNA(Gln) amidotransferase subunit E-like FAD-binding protein